MNHFANGKLNYCRVDFLHYLIHNNITKPTIDTTLAPILTLNKTRVHFHLRPTNATSFLPSQRLININSGVKSLIGRLVAATDPSVLLLIQANPSIHPTTQSLALILDLKNSNLRTNTNNFTDPPQFNSNVSQGGPTHFTLCLPLAIWRNSVDRVKRTSSQYPHVNNDYDVLSLPQLISQKHKLRT